MGPAVMLEREDQIARIDRALRLARDGYGTLVFVEGPAGIGKTAMVGVAAAQAAAAGMQVLRACGAQLEREYAFGVVRQLFEPALGRLDADQRADVLQGPAGVAAGLLGLPGAAGETEPMTSADASFAALHGLYWLCANLAARQPLCLVIDDAHWADTPSLRYLAFLLGRLRELPGAVLIAARPGEGGPGEALLAALAADSQTEVTRPAPLSQRAVGCLIEERLGATAEPGFVAACHHATGGTPFLVGELLAALHDVGVAPTEAEVAQVRGMGSPSVGRWMLVRLGRLTPAAAELARAVAVLEHAELPLAAELAQLSVAQALTAADELIAGGILGPERRLAFVHPIIRAGVYGELSRRERARGHRLAAQLLDAAHAVGERVAEHLLASEPAGEPWVADRLADVARAAARSGAPESAAVYLRRALAEPPAANRRAALLLELGLAEESAGDAIWSERLHAALTAADEGPPRIQAALMLAQALARAQRSGEAVELIDRAAGWLGSAGAQLGSVLEAAAVTVGMIDVGTAPAMTPRAGAIRRRADADPAPAREVLAVAAFVTVLSNEPARIGSELARRALTAGPALPEGANTAWFSQSVSASIWAGSYEQVEAVLDAAIVHGRTSGNSGLLALGLAHRGWLALRRGDLQAAEQDTRTAVDAADLPAPLLFRLLAAGILAETLTERGELDEAERVLADLDPGAGPAALGTVVFRYGRARLLAARRRTRDALEDFLSVGELAGRLSCVCPGFRPWRSQAALAQLALGEPGAARELAETELQLARAFGAPGPIGIAARAAGVVAGGPAGEALLREAVAALATAGAPLERARALTELGALVGRAGRRAEARPLLAEALDRAHRAGARPLAEQAESELRVTGAKPRRVLLTGIESLTAGERRVAQLAGEGLTNREIAQTLFVTARTVEGHLTRVFAKLELSSRDGLADALAAG